MENINIMEIDVIASKVSSFVCSFAGISKGDVQLQLPKLPTLLRAGLDVELRCHVEGSGDMRYEWFK